MLDKIQNTTPENIGQSQSLDRISQIGVSNPFVEDSRDSYFIDEYQISPNALAKYQHEQDVKRFSDILLETNEKEANELVLQKALDGSISIDNDEFLSELLTNSNFLDDLIQ